MKISLLYPPRIEEYGKISYFVKKSEKLPQLNLAYLASIAEKQGHEVQIINGEVNRMFLEDIVKKTLEFNPAIVGITFTTPFYHTSISLAENLKEKNKEITIVIGGPHITEFKEKAFKNCFDYAFIGAVDNSWPEFLQIFERQKNVRTCQMGEGVDFSEVRGILYRENEKVNFTGKSKPLEEINSTTFSSKTFIE